MYFAPLILFYTAVHTFYNIVVILILFLYPKSIVCSKSTIHTCTNNQQFVVSMRFVCLFNSHTKCLRYFMNIQIVIIIIVKSGDIAIHSHSILIVCTNNCTFFMARRKDDITYTVIGHSIGILRQGKRTWIGLFFYWKDIVSRS